jgi:benzodiazapine receptor
VRLPALLLYLVAVAVVAGVGGLASTSGVEGWYADADKPFFTPPNWLFGPAWTFLYTAMAVAAWLVHRRREDDPAAPGVLRLWWLQLAVNFAWTPVFFAAQWLFAGLAVIVLLDVLVAALLVRAWRVSRPAGLLLAPYLAWILYATALNAGVALLN